MTCENLMGMGNRNNVLTIIQQSWIMKSQGAKIELWDNLKNTFSRKKTEG